MSSLDDRERWLDHLSECMLCPTNRCHRGDELAAAIREDLAPGESWAGIYRPRRTEHGPAISAADRRRIAQDEAAERSQIV